MSEPSELRRLGRGLSALLAAVEAPPQEAVQHNLPPERTLPIHRIVANPNQPRKNFDGEALADLAESLRHKGLIQPLVVRPRAGTDTFEIVAGERRWRAAHLADLAEVPVVVRDFDDDELLQVAVIENIQREDLNPLEEAMAYRQLLDRFGHTQEQLAEALSKSRSHIANLLRLLSLPEPVQDMLREEKLSMGQARALITAKDPIGLAQVVAQKGLSVREVEALARREERDKTNPPEETRDVGRTTAELMQRLSTAMGMSTSISLSRDGQRGKLSVSFESLAELEQLCELIERTRASTLG
ncbi:MAG: ParB/RepB/Spo0J family partition protein [Paracoccaceae bacterium]